MAGTAEIRFIWSDWSNDRQLKMCSIGARGLWMEMLCIASECEPAGYVAIGTKGLCVSEIASIAGIDKTLAGTLIAELERNGIFSRTARGTIFSRRMVRERRMADQRAKSQDPASGALSAVAKPARKPRTPKAEIAEPDGFAEFWSAYGHKVGRKNAVKAYVKAVAKTPHATIMAGIAPFHRAHPEREYWPHPATWLNGERWADEYPSLAPVVPINPAAVDWDLICRAYLRTKIWTYAGSPEPGEAGCLVPADVLARHGLPPTPVAYRPELKLVQSA